MKDLKNLIILTDASLSALFLSVKKNNKIAYNDCSCDRLKLLDEQATN